MKQKETRKIWKYTIKKGKLYISEVEELVDDYGVCWRYSDEYKAMFGVYVPLSSGVYLPKRDDEHAIQTMIEYHQLRLECIEETYNNTKNLIERLKQEL